MVEWKIYRPRFAVFEAPPEGCPGLTEIQIGLDPGEGDLAVLVEEDEGKEEHRLVGGEAGGVALAGAVDAEGGVFLFFDQGDGPKDVLPRRDIPGG